MRYRVLVETITDTAIEQRVTIQDMPKAQAELEAMLAAGKGGPNTTATVFYASRVFRGNPEDDGTFSEV